MRKSKKVCSRGFGIYIDTNVLYFSRQYLPFYVKKISVLINLIRNDMIDTKSRLLTTVLNFKLW